MAFSLHVVKILTSYTLYLHKYEQPHFAFENTKKKYYVDLGEFIFQGIQKFLRGNSQYSIPYVSIVTRLCKAVGVTWPSHEQLQIPAALIDSANIIGMKEWTGGEPEPHGLGYTFPEG